MVHHAHNTRASKTNASLSKKFLRIDGHECHDRECTCAPAAF